MADYQDDLESDCCVSTEPNHPVRFAMHDMPKDFRNTKDLMDFKNSNIDQEQHLSLYPSNASSGYFSESLPYSSGTSSLGFKEEDLDELTSKAQSLKIDDVKPEINSSNSEHSVNICSSEEVATSLSEESLSINSLDFGNFSRPPRNLTEVQRLTPDALQVFGRDEDGDNLLHVAIIQGAAKHALGFVQMAPGPDWLNMYNKDLHQTALHLAAITDNVLIARRLMIGGANVEMRDHNGDTPLHIACREGLMKMVQTLLKPVSDSEEIINEYDTKRGSIPQNLELRNCEGYTCLHEAVINRKYDIVVLLLDNGADVNVRDGKQGATVLHYAAMTGDETLAAYLVKHRGINLNSPTYCGTTPAQLAYLKKNRVYDILVRAGACKVTDADVQPVNSDSSDEEDYFN